MSEKRDLRILEIAYFIMLLAFVVISSLWELRLYDYDDNSLQKYGAQFSAGKLVAQGEPPAPFKIVEQKTYGTTQFVLLQMGAKNYLVQYEKIFAVPRYKDSIAAEATAPRFVQERFRAYDVDASSGQLVFKDQPTNIVQMIKGVPYQIWALLILFLIGVRVLWSTCRKKKRLVKTT